MGRILGFLAVAGLGVVMYNRWKTMNDFKRKATVKKKMEDNFE
jgi:hypothetical protein